MNITAKELSGMHLGKVVDVELQRSRITGELDSFYVEREPIHQSWLGAPTEWKWHVTLNIGGVEYDTINGETPITIQEEQ